MTKHHRSTNVASHRNGRNGVRTTFDAAYYRRFYLDAGTRVHDEAEQHRLAAFVFSYLDYLQIPVRNLLDLGCGLGHWGRELELRHPDATYTGVDASEYACRIYGWEQGTAATFRGRGQYDLVVCQGVLQYAGDDEVRRSLANIARLCRGAVYLEIPTQRDWREHCDRSVTDGEINLRTGEWYRNAISRHFRSAGGGLFLPNDSPVVLYELESLGQSS
jgi:SAM-dependent methyltransferase